MAKDRTHSLLAIDFVGGGAVAACVLVFAWLTLIRGDDVSAQILDLTQAVQTARQELAVVEDTRDHQRIVLEERQAELLSRGHLPHQTPIERYFQTLSALAAEHQLRVRRHHPVSPRHYPGLLELRYAYELSGTMPDLTRFFRAIEETEFWADISYLKVEQGPGLPRSGSTQRIASLTISLFSALPVETVSDKG